jgi:hypothetical protein
MTRATKREMKRRERSRSEQHRPTRRAAADQPQTPLRALLRSSSPLRPFVRDGLAAVERGHRDYLAAELRRDFADSLDLDAAMRTSHPEANRWDYLLGHHRSDCVIGVEPHSARTDQVSVVIAKREHARAQLRGHLREQGQVAAWIWVASGRVDFLQIDRVRRQLDSVGVHFVGGQLRVDELERIITRKK